MEKSFINYNQRIFILHNFEKLLKLSTDSKTELHDSIILLSKAKALWHVTKVGFGSPQHQLHNN